MGKIDFSKPAAVLDRLVRGMNPWPSAYTVYKGKQMKIWKAKPVTSGAEGTADNAAAKPGEIVAVGKDFFDVATGEGVLRVLELQLEGKKRMNTHDFLLGVKLQCGEMLGEA
jgi:methionyl-tRNA formyltransferase